MTPNFYGAIRLGACASCAAGGLALGDPATVAQTTTGQGITVTAPRQIGRSPYTRAPITEVTESRVVTYHDLDLTGPTGLGALDKRIATAAREACRDLETHHPLGAPDRLTCQKQAVASAREQLASAKAMAMQSRTPPTAGAATTNAPEASAVEPAPNAGD